MDRKDKRKIDSKIVAVYYTEWLRVKTLSAMTLVASGELVSLDSVEMCNYDLTPGISQIVQSNFFSFNEIGSWIFFRLAFSSFSFFV